MNGMRTHVDPQEISRGWSAPWLYLFILIQVLACTGSFDDGVETAPALGQASSALASGASDTNAGAPFQTQALQRSALAAAITSTRPTAEPTPPLPSTATNQDAPLGQGEVTPRGTFKYTIPIEVPEGRAGMAPNLSLVYESDAGNGPLGVGWSIRGSSEITRCDGVVASGGVRKRVEYDSTDKFCLDGQRLVLVAGENGLVGAEYRTEVDSFARVKITNTFTFFDSVQPTAWKVEFKDGTHAIYGEFDDNQWGYHRPLLRADGTIAGGGQVRPIWPMAGLHDRAGNVVQWSNDNSDPSGSGNFPLHGLVRYTCHESSSCFDDANFEVDFVYQDRASADILERYVNGVRFKNSKRLEKIVVKSRDPRQVIREYRLGYQQSVATKRTLLTTVTLCDGAGVCFPATTFTYGDSLGQHAVHTASTVAGTNNFSYLGRLRSGLPGTYEMEIVAFDANGDGNDDILLHDHPATSVPPTARLVLADGVGYFTHAEDVNWDGSPCGRIYHMAGGTPVDLDSDGRAELVHECFEDGYRVLGWDSTEGELREKNVVGLSGKAIPRWEDRNPYSDGRPYAEGLLRFGDLDGDGLPDMLSGNTQVGNDRWIAQRAIFTPGSGDVEQVSYGTNRRTAIPSAGPDPSSTHPDWGRVGLNGLTTFLDQDGDGHLELTIMDYATQMRGYTWGITSDVVYTLRNDHGNRLLREENNFSSEPSTTEIWGQTFFSGNWERGLWYFLDVNGDGLQDGLYREGPCAGSCQNPPPAGVAWYLRINTGAGYLPPATVGPAQATLNAYEPDIFVDALGFVTKGLDNGLRVGDMNGDGRDDIVLLHPGGTLTPFEGWSSSTQPARVLYSNGTGFDAPVSLPSYGAGYRRLMKSTGSENPRFPMSTLADIDGNGIMELVELVGGVPGFRSMMTTSVGLGHGIDVMTIASQNGKTRDSAHYAALTFDTSGTYSLQAAPEYPLAAATRRSIVRRHTAITAERSVDLHYDYETALMDVTGRGFLGFETIRERDEARGVTTTHTNDFTPVEVGSFRHYPHLERPSSSEQGLPGSQHDASLADATGVIGRPRTTWSAVFAGHPLRKESEISRWFITSPSESVSRVFSEATYDDYGNPESVVTTSIDEFAPGSSTLRTYTHTLETEFDNDETTWRLGEARRRVERLQADTGANPRQGTPPTSDDIVRTVDFSYDDNGLLETIVREPEREASADSRVSIERFFRDGFGNITSHWSYAPTGETCSTTPDCGSGSECRRAVEPDGVLQCFAYRIEDFTYDASGTHVESATNAAGHTSWALRDPIYGWVYLTADPNAGAGDWTEYIIRDGFGRERENFTVDGPPRSDTTYGAGVVYEDFPFDGSKTATFTDSIGRPDLFTWVTFDGGTGIGKRTYDALGNVIATHYGSSASPHSSVAATRATAIAALGAGTQITAAQYDVLGRPASTTKGVSETSGYTYGSPMGEVTVTDARGFATTQLPDVQGRIVSLTQTNNAGAEFTTTYGYGADGELSSLRNPEGVTERFTRDSIGRPVRWSTGMANAGGTHNTRWEATYDGFDDIVEEEKDGVIAEYTRDELGRPTVRSTQDETQEYFWDPPEHGMGSLGLMTTDAQGGHETEFTYDFVGRLDKRIERFADGTELSLRFEYDPNHGQRLARIYYPEASPDHYATPHTIRTRPIAQYSYQNGYLRALADASTATPTTLWEATTRHPLGMVKGFRHFGSQSMTSDRSYDNNTLRLKAQATFNIQPSPTFSYTYHPNGDLKTKTIGGITETFDYDSSRGFLRTYKRQAPGSSLLEATLDYSSQGISGVDTTTSTASPDWTQDETYTYRTNDLRRNYHLVSHRVGSAPTQSLTYSNGRVTEVREGSTLKRRYTWNSFSLPSSVEHFGPNLTRTFVYDALGARVKKRQDANNEVHYVTSLYEGRNLTAQNNTKESVFRFVAEGRVVAERVHTWGGTSASTRHIFSDTQDTPGFVVVGTTSTQLGFFPFGKRMNVAPATPPAQTFSQLGYTGHRHDDDIGLINMNGRVYDITTRRFLTPDAVLDQPFTTFGTQPYSYVAHNPTNFTDPTGFYAGDNRWRTESLITAQQQQHSSCGCVCIGNPAHPKEWYDRQWGGEGSDDSDDSSSKDWSINRGQSGGRSWVTMSAGGIQSIQNSGLLAPSSLGNLGSARSSSVTQSPSQIAHADKIKRGVEILKRFGPQIVSGVRRDARTLQQLGQEWWRRAQQDVRWLEHHGQRLWQAARGGSATATKLNHIFGKAEHALEEFVKAQGGQQQAFQAIQNAANQALKEGKLVVGPNGILPRGNAGNIINVAGTQIRLIGGRVIDGVVQIGSASRKGLPP